MIYITRNPLVAFAGLALSLTIFLILYFTVIKPTTDTSNQAVRDATKQSQQLVKQVDKQTGGAVPASAKKLTDCLAAAGADTTKLQACQAAAN